MLCVFGFRVMSDKVVFSQPPGTPPSNPSSSSAAPIIRLRPFSRDKEEPLRLPRFPSHKGPLADPIWEEGRIGASFPIPWPCRGPRGWARRAALMSSSDRPGRESMDEEDKWEARLATLRGLPLGQMDDEGGVRQRRWWRGRNGRSEAKWNGLALTRPGDPSFSSKRRTAAEGGRQQTGTPFTGKSKGNETDTAAAAGWDLAEGLVWRGGDLLGLKPGHRFFVGFHLSEKAQWSFGWYNLLVGSRTNRAVAF